MKGLILAIGGFILIGCAAGPPTLLLPDSGSVAAVAPSAEYHVGPGDVLRINVFGHPELSSQMIGGGSAGNLVNNAIGSDTGTPVDGTGHIQLPLVGPVFVDGMSPLGVREAVTEALTRFLKSPSVDVAVLRFSSQRFVVMGEALEPGVYSLQRPMTAMEALSMAGGYNESANREQLIWMRGGLGEENLVMLNGSGLDAKAAMLVQHGDVFYIGRRPWADRAEAVKDIIPLLQAVTVPLSIATQFMTLERLLDD